MALRRHGTAAVSEFTKPLTNALTSNIDLELNSKSDELVTKPDPPDFGLRASIRPSADAPRRLATVGRPRTSADLAQSSTRCDAEPETGVSRPSQRTPVVA